MELAEAGDRERHQRRGRGLERRRPQPPAAQAGDRLQLGLGLGEPGHDRLGVADDGLARVGEADATRAALHERRARLALERGDLLRDGGLGERQRLGRRGERAAHRDLAEHTHAADVEHQPNLYHPLRTFICTDGPLTLSCAEPLNSHMPAPAWKVWGALWIVYIVWGSTYLAIRVMVETVPPLLGAGVRFAVAGRSWSACSPCAGGCGPRARSC